MSVQEYRLKNHVIAERIPEGGEVFTVRGKEFANEGDYLVHSLGATLIPGSVFDAQYEVVPDSIVQARKFNPDGKTVDEVLNFFRENPDEIERVKELERGGGNRKGITDYEIR